MMLPLLIIITAESELKGESGVLGQMLNRFPIRVHIRKPAWSKAKIAGLLEQLSPFRKQMSLHGNMDLALEYGLGGVHLPLKEITKAESLPPTMVKSTSVHNWQEASAVVESVDYMFVSPVFNSISKRGYQANAALKHIPELLPRQKLIALGGINPVTAKTAMDTGYGGVASIGFIWQDNPLKQLEDLYSSISTYKTSMPIS